MPAPNATARLCVLLAAWGLVACRRESSSTSGVAATSAPAAASAAPAASASANLGWRVPSGPSFGILPGQGIGPIRFGANVGTIERLMEAPCDTKNETLCRYVNRGVDFHLQEGVLHRIHLHREDRPVPGKPDMSFGPFNGGFKEAIGFGMYRNFVITALGKPEREETQAADALETVSRDHYPGLVLEYDQLPNGNVVLGGAVITRVP